MKNIGIHMPLFKNLRIELTFMVDVISIIISAIESRNNSQNYPKYIPLRLLPPNTVKLLISNVYLKNC